MTDDNIIEETLSEVGAPVNDANIELVKGALQAMEAKSHAVNKFVGPDDLATQLTPSERKLIPLLQYMAKNPFPRMLEWTKYNKSPEAYELMKEIVQNEMLKNFLSEYMRLGFAVSRKGRLEGLEALKSYLVESENPMLTNPDNKRGGLL